MQSHSAASRMLVLSMLVLGACAPGAVSAPEATMGVVSTSEAMMTDETPTADAMMRETPSGDGMAAAPEPSMQKADWLGTPLTDAVTGEAFQVDAYQGKVVLVETMAVWCTNCRAQQEQIKGLQSQMMEQTSDLVLLSLDVDPNENADTLRKYVNTTGFAWTFAVAPPDLIRTIGLSYGDQFLNPSSTPILILDRHGMAHPLPFGIKSAQNLMEAIQPYLAVSG
jgi:cytochrome oxidase Cu insertion factor (SCO1/SenC/PrrC family)